MDPLTIVLIVLGLTLTFIGGIVLLIAAFQQNVWWGLASLFLPLASLVFVVCHWSRAKTGFGLSVLGSAVLAGACFQAAPFLRETFARAAGLPMLGAASKAPGEDQSIEIQVKRTRLEILEGQFAQDGAALAKRFEELTARRKALPASDPAAVVEFNAEANTYQAQNAARKQAKQELDTTRQELEALLDLRARNSAAAASSKAVVMFTTATCPACTAAKSYLARKGIRYEERDVNTSAEARAEFQRLGGRGVPLILVGKERMEGFNAARFEQLL